MTHSRARSRRAKPQAARRGSASAARIGGGPIDKIQRAEFQILLNFLREFWQDHARHVDEGRVGPAAAYRVLRDVAGESLPVAPARLPDLLKQTKHLLRTHSVKTTHPLFLGYVTPSALDIGALADAMAAIVNQNVAFASLSPIGTALEESAIRWLGEIVGYPPSCGGILTSGGSEANLYALAAARRCALGTAFITDGNYAERNRRLRIYCSEHTHHSVDKAVMLLGLGTSSIKRIPVDSAHRIKIDALRIAIEADRASGDWLPMAIVGTAGTRLCCAYDDFRALRKVADNFDLWLHVDAAFGGFLRLATPRPPGSDQMHHADSIAVNPHKLLFVPLDCGAILVRDPSHLSAAFGAEGEYLEPRNPGLRDFANFGMQLGRPMRALKVWLAIKRFGRETLGKEYSRLLQLARYLSDRIRRDRRFELLGPVSGTAVCFRWRGRVHSKDPHLDALNSEIRLQIVRAGVAFVDEVELSGKRGLRVCMTNFRTNSCHLDTLIDTICQVATNTSGDGTPDGRKFYEPVHHRR